jgi:DNA invertase Pin-like site-specific DNA recombinase
MEQYVTYYRVSSRMQGKDGNGIKAQRQAVQGFLKAQEAQEVETFTEVESGTNGDRPVLKDAIRLCKETGSTLLIAKLDRLSRNVAFLFNLRDELKQAGVSFKALDLPDDANNTMALGMLATFAQHEADRISERTKAGIRQSEKYKAGEWGNPEYFTEESRKKAWASISHKARTDEDTLKAFHFIEPRREKGMTYAEIAEQLNKFKYRTRRGKKFHPAQVRKIYLRFTEEN